MVTKLRDLIITNVDLVDKGANPDARIVLFKRDDTDDIDKAEWTTAYINDLPDSSFAVIEAGGTKDNEGKTKPRGLRHLPYKDANGSIDLPHLRNAFSRLPQTSISDELKTQARGKLVAAARSAKIGEFRKMMDDIMTFMEGDDNMPNLQDILNKLTDEEKGVVNAEMAKTKTAEDALVKSKEAADVKDAELIKVTKELEDLKKAGEGDEEGGEKDILKSADPAVKAYVEGLKKEIGDTSKKAQDSEDRVEKLETSIKKAEFIQKASEFKGLTIKPEEFGEVLMNIAKAAPEDYEKLMQVLKSADKVIVEGELVKTIGAGGEGEPGDSAQAMEKKAQEIAKRDNIPYEQGYAKACEENKDLYAKIQKGE